MLIHGIIFKSILVGYFSYDEELSSVYTPRHAYVTVRIDEDLHIEKKEATQNKGSPYQRIFRGPPPAGHALWRPLLSVPC